MRTSSNDIMRFFVKKHKGVCLIFIYNSLAKALVLRTTAPFFK